MTRCLYGVISYKFISVGRALFLSVVRRLSARSSPWYFYVGRLVRHQQRSIDLPSLLLV